MGELTDRWVRGFYLAGWDEEDGWEWESSSRREVPCLEHKGFVLTAKIREGCSAASVCTEHGMGGVVWCAVVMVKPPGAAYVFGVRK